MGAGHAHALHFHGHSPLHRMQAHHKVLGLLGFVLIVVATPSRWWPAYVVEAVVLLGLVVLARLPLGYVLKRMVVEVPFVVFALLMPFIAQGPTTEFLGLTVSESGLTAAWTLLVKATLGVVAGICLAATTEAPDLLRGLARLRLPNTMVQIMSFMLRYLEVVVEEFRRQQIALASRGFVARNPRHWPVLATSAGALFIRSYERGERVHLAMLSRGYTGRLP
ncbi:cobalt ECF transporter T component CbiQ [Nocardioides sp.]|uniref:cobalt ECF transporter T component CbiQ n=1 Tax=Nocardioides sp. TaxID=35761 RepID=UPI0026211BF4|nr:cobalt ECF transporter T component CbiQ [Nocardioides sp.]